MFILNLKMDNKLKFNLKRQSQGNTIDSFFSTPKGKKTTLETMLLLILFRVELPVLDQLFDAF